MVVVKIELWPKGDESKAREIGRAEIALKKVNSANAGNYEARLSHAGIYYGKPGWWKLGKVIAWPRTQSPYHLVLRALQACLVAERKPAQVNVGRATSGGVFNGLFGNPVKEKVVSEQFRQHIRWVLQKHPGPTKWLDEQLRKGAKLYCPGCGINAAGCHARIIEQELKRMRDASFFRH